MTEGFNCKSSEEYLDYAKNNDILTNSNAIQTQAADDNANDAFDEAQFADEGYSEEDISDEDIKKMMYSTDSDIYSERKDEDK